MGKTSLLFEVLSQMTRASRPTVFDMHIDLNLVHDEVSLEQAVRRLVIQVAVKMRQSGTLKDGKLVECFAPFSPVLTDDGGRMLSLRPLDSLPDGIKKLLTGLDKAAQSARCRVVIAWDELQHMSQLTYKKADVALEEALAYSVGRAQHTTHLVSGSYPLEDMLASRRPLFERFEKMEIDRISADDYRRHLYAAAHQRWGADLDNQAVREILQLCNEHPYWLSALCERLWREPELPSVEIVKLVWTSVCHQHLGRVRHDVRRLSATQRAMLIAIAQQQRVSQLTNRAFLSDIRLASSTGNAAKDVLDREDFIEQDEKGVWRLVNPVMAEYLLLSHTLGESAMT